ncbi:Uncharacterised protein [Mycobacteroides abscessus subsp. abscessus]|uniref:hypothetical protein n=1 Tax=Mycobacteroides abscessus TaxID=36809 RepID=UPI000927955E|nr:hypothetical protein [Mycobacteroides abscessus]SII19974.1 Uncharacterised protein [Mycobacteroides abscessus subsp. abscessus]SII33359.1 Uncharacterised protein [Mycobacteroides abscessus subsp. abscessus]SII65624.1 Uncharacterised protein [Mycobacteroides abscessus subsp. abscessus]
MWVDNQAPYVYGFYSLTPHQLIPDDETRISGHAGGVLSGYLIAKFGVNKRAAEEATEVEYESGPGKRKRGPFPNPVLLLIDAIVDAERASRHGGGRYAFIDTANEPKTVLEAVSGLGFKPIKPEGSTLQFIKLTPFRDEP